MRKIFRTVICAALSSAFVFSGAVSAAAFDVRDAEPQRDIESPEYVFYYSDNNVFQKMGYGMANCTAYAWGRIYEILGTKPSLSINNAGRWYKYNINEGPYSYGCEPREGAVACWDKFDDVNGHVAVVETVSEDRSMITLSESQYRGLNFRYYSQTADSSGYWKGYRFLGYIYTDETEKHFYGDAFKISGSDSTYLTYSENMQPEMRNAVSNTALQNFRFEPLANGNYKIWSVTDDVLLYSNDSEAQFFSDDSSADTEWKLIKESNGKFSICRPDNENKVLSIIDNNAVISEYSSHENQLFDLNRVTGVTELSFSERMNDFTINCEGSRTEYFTEEFLDISGIKFMINGNELNTIDITKLNTEYDFSTPGEKTVKISYDNFTAEYQVTVVEPEEGMETMRNNVFDLPVARNLIDLNDIEFHQEFDLNCDNVIDASDVLLALK